jgi:hypothetical protein
MQWMFTHNQAKSSFLCLVLLNLSNLVKIPESVKDNDKITSETAPDNSSKSDNENKDIPDQTDYCVTRSGRISKSPDKLNL